MAIASQPQSGTGERSFIRWMKAHDLLAFFLLIFVLTFGFWLAATLTQVAALFDVGLWGPALAAILLTAITRGMPGLKELGRRLLHWRVPLKWYLIILIGYPATILLAAVLHALVTGQPLAFQWNQWSGFLAFLASAPVLAFWACEEIGWRGFALPRLLKRWNALVSSVILGIFWAAWHLPYYLGPDGLSPAFYLMPVLTIAMSIFMTWVWRHTQGSLFVATFFHFWVNIYSALQTDKLPLANPGGQTVIEYGLLAMAAVLVVAFFGPKQLTRRPENGEPVAANAEMQ